MSIFDEIARGGNARPLAAFMVGREQKRARERQEQLDTLDEEFTRKRIEQHGSRIDLEEKRFDLAQERNESLARQEGAAAEREAAMAKRKADLEERRFKLEERKFEADVDLELKKLEKGPSGGKITSTQRAAAGYGVRLKLANDIFDDLSSEGHDFTNIPDRISGSGLMPQGLKSNARQKQEQAERNFINANLRRESGAAINPSEFESAEIQYFPRPGDKPEVLEQKRLNRLAAQAALTAEAGPAFDQVLTELDKLTVPQGGSGASSDGPVEPQSQEEYDALPSGAQYLDGGQIRIKK